MRKFFEKFAALMQAVVSTLFVIFILLLLTGALDKADFHNNVVYILFGTFIFIHIIFTGLVLYFQYSMDVLSSVQIYSEGENKSKISISVIRNIIKRATKHIGGIKIRHSSISYDEKGLILNNPIKVSERELSGAIEEVRTTIINTFKEKLSLEFFSINFKIIGYKYQTPTVRTVNIIPEVKRESTTSEKVSETPKLTPDAETSIVAADMQKTLDTQTIESETISSANEPESIDIATQSGAIKEALLTEDEESFDKDFSDDAQTDDSMDAESNLFNENENEEETETNPNAADVVTEEIE